MTIGLHRSFLATAGMVAIHGLAFAAAVFTPWPLWVRVAVIAAFTVSLAVSRRLWFARVTGLRLLGDGRLECQFAGEEGFRPAELLPGATVHPWLTAVRLKLPEGRVALVVLPDCTTIKEFRCLRVWLRWQADFTAAKDAA
ncbi:MAG TPA: protein YgfX [Rhodocyclaceae bacterium]|nr:protein YgfX [Rhodocyclaceae bacterium]